MKTVKRFFTTLVFSFICRPYILMSQNGETHIDNLEVQDSSYMEMPFMDAVMKNTGSSNTIIIIVLALVVIAAVAYFILKKK